MLKKTEMIRNSFIQLCYIRKIFDIILKRSEKSLPSKQTNSSSYNRQDWAVSLMLLLPRMACPQLYLVSVITCMSYNILFYASLNIVSSWDKKHFINTVRIKFIRNSLHILRILTRLQSYFKDLCVFFQTRKGNLQIKVLMKKYFKY